MIMIKTIANIKYFCNFNFIVYFIFVTCVFYFCRRFSHTIPMFVRFSFIHKIDKKSYRTCSMVGQTILKSRLHVRY